MSSIFAERTTIVLHLINEYGCMTTSQINELCLKKDLDEECAARQAYTMMSHLILVNSVHEHDGVYVPVKEPKVDTQVIDSLWVAIDKSRKEDGTIDLNLLNMSFPSKPVQVSLILANKFYNIVSLSEDNVSSTLPFMIEKFNHDYPVADKAKGLEYLFVVREEDTIKEIAAYAPPMPNRIALIQGEITAKPTIRYLSPKRV